MKNKKKVELNVFGRPIGTEWFISFDTRASARALLRDADAPKRWYGACGIIRGPHQR